MRYYKHGYGCSVALTSGNVDFNFGNEGQIDGIDLWKLIVFAEKRLESYGFPSEQSIKSAFQSSIDSNEIKSSQYMLYYLAKQNG